MCTQHVISQQTIKILIQLQPGQAEDLTVLLYSLVSLLALSPCYAESSLLHPLCSFNFCQMMYTVVQRSSICSRKIQLCSLLRSKGSSVLTTCIKVLLGLWSLGGILAWRLYLLCDLLHFFLCCPAT